MTNFYGSDIFCVDNRIRRSFRAGCNSRPVVKAHEPLLGLTWCDSRADGNSPDERRHCFMYTYIPWDLPGNIFMKEEVVYE